MYYKMSKISSFALIVPCYNEEASISLFAQELFDFINRFHEKHNNIKLEVIIVDNNSTDNSQTMLKEVELKNPAHIKLIKCSTLGYGAALKCGFSSSDANYLSFADLDNTYPLASLLDLFSKLLQEGMDMVYGARIHPRSKISYIRYWGNQFYVFLMKLFFKSKLTDVCSGMRVFRANFKTSILNIPTDDLSFSIGLTAHALINKWKISEVPILYRERTGVSKLSVSKDGFLFLKMIVKQYFNRNNNEF